MMPFTKFSAPNGCALRATDRAIRNGESSLRLRRGEEGGMDREGMEEREKRGGEDGGRGQTGRGVGQTDRGAEGQRDTGVWHTSRQTRVNESIL